MIREALRRARRRLRVGPIHRWRFSGGGPDRLLVTPPELRRGDPIIAESIYGGRFHFAGQLVSASGRSVFQVIAPSRGWAADLHSFEWLRHLGEAGDPLAAHNARSLVGDWMRLAGHAMGGVAHDPDVAARRIVAWLTHSNLILAEADYAFYRRFMKSLAQQTRYLRSVASEAPEGVARLKARIALAFASLCLPTTNGRIRIAARNLGEELDRQIFADGGHASRNPAAIPDLLADLLPLRQTYVGQGQVVPKGLYSAIDRMLPALRFFRHSDGSLALFNGASVCDAHLLAALLRFDETLGEPISNARQSGYQRLAAGGTVLITDAGVPPAPELSGEAHAGTLAFEFSSGPSRIVVNCGAPAREDAEWRRLARTTAAHSTLTLADHSSSRFSRSDMVERFLGTPLIAGPTSVPVSRDDASELGFTAVHDGYRPGFGLLHERQIALSKDGGRIEGRDRLYTATGKPPPKARGGRRPLAAIRFHLHPSVQAVRTADGFRLAARGQVWRFSAKGDCELADSIFFADHSGPRRTLQIVVGFDPATQDSMGWSFAREE